MRHAAVARRTYLPWLLTAVLSLVLVACAVITGPGSLPAQPPAGTPAPQPVERVEANDPAINYSPYTWLVGQPAAKTINSGAYLRLKLGGPVASLVAHFDTQHNLTPFPQIKYRLDGGPWSTATIAAAVPLDVTDSGDGEHELELVVKATSQAMNRWNAPQETAVSFTGISSSAGLRPMPSEVRPLRILAYGDSIAEGIRTINNTAPVETDQNDSTTAWAYPLTNLMDAEVGVVGFGGLGLVNPGIGNVPPAPDSFKELWAGSPRNFTPAPDLVLVNLGTNDAKVDVTQATTRLLSRLLATTPPSTRVGVIYPWIGTGQKQLAAAVAATNQSGRISIIDSTGWWKPADSSDGVHPLGHANTESLSPRVADAARALIQGR